MSDAFDDHNFIDVTPPQPDVPLWERMARLEAALSVVHGVVDAVYECVKPKERKPRTKGDPDVLAALDSLAARTGVPVKPADKVELQRATALHGKEPMLASLAALLNEDLGHQLARAIPAFVNRNLIGTAAAQCGRRKQRGAVGPVVWTKGDDD